VAPVQGVISTLCASSIAMSSSRIVAIGAECAHPQRARVVVSTNGGRTWTAGAAPAGLRVNTTLTRAASVSYVAGRFVVTGGNTAETATWVWSSPDGGSWRRVASMPRTKIPGWTVDTIVGVFRVGAGYVALGHRDMPADDAVLVAWRSADLAHWTRFSPPTAPTCDATVHMVGQASVVGGALVAVGNPWGMVSQCGETWRARVTP